MWSLDVIKILILDTTNNQEIFFCICDLCIWEIIDVSKFSLNESPECSQQDPVNPKTSFFFYQRPLVCVLVK